MIQHTQILKRSWNILWSYRVLWVFGVILALTSAGSANGGSNGGGGGGGNGGSSRMILPADGIEGQVRQLGHNVERLLESIQPDELAPWMVGALIAAGVAGLVLGVIFTIGHFVSQTALIRMVDHLENSGEKLSWRQGFRLGWSRAAWRLFLISLLIGVAGILVFGLLSGVAALPAIIGSLAGESWTAIGIILTIGLGLPVLFLAILVGLLFSLLMEMIRRTCVMDNRGVIDSIRLGWLAVRQNFRDVGVMWLLTIGIRLGLAIVLIPMVMVLVGVAILFGGGLGGLVYLVFSGLTAGWVIAASLGGLVFLAIMVLPLTFVSGLEQTYLSSTWTLTYRALKMA